MDLVGIEVAGLLNYRKLLIIQFQQKQALHRSRPFSSKSCRVKFFANWLLQLDAPLASSRKQSLLAL